jgi:dGTPase
VDWKRLLSGKRLRELMAETSVAPPYTDFRTPFEQDYGRAAFSTPVRRLQHKAQVFPLEPIDAVRTRLTHSLEVSSVARSLTRETIRNVKDDTLDEDLRYIIETIAATCGLLHDTGNPPFGHFGETAIRSWFKDKSRLLEQMSPEHAKDLECFEGNAHTIRLVSRLQVLSDFRGLNLTAGTMSALLKYTVPSTEIDPSETAPQSRRKLGYFQSESEEIQRVQEETGTGNSRNPITYLVEASDDLVYLTVDLEDAVKKGIVRWEDFQSELEKHDSSLFPDVGNFAEKCQDLHTGSALSEAKAQYFRTIAIRMGAKAVSKCFLENYQQIMSGQWDQELLYVSDAREFFAALKNFSVKHIYNSKQTVLLEILGHNVMHDLLDLFAKAEQNRKPTTFQRKIYDLMSKNYRSVYEKALLSKLPPAYCKALLLTDYICGMTDSFAVRLHRDLTQRSV